MTKNIDYFWVNFAYFIGLVIPAGLRVSEVGAHMGVSVPPVLGLACFLIGTLAGVTAMLRHLAHMNEPWKVPAIQVNVLYLTMLVAFSIPMLG